MCSLDIVLLQLGCYQLTLLFYYLDHHLFSHLLACGKNSKEVAVEIVLSVSSLLSHYHGAGLAIFKPIFIPYVCALSETVW